MNDYAKLIAEFQNAVLKAKPEVGDALAVARENFDGKAQMQAYINDYRLRLIAAVKTDYPATLNHLGVDALVSAYVEITPSTSTNLNPYPWGFADYLESKVDGMALAIAKLERAISQSYQAEDSPALTHAWLATQKEDYLLTHPLKPRTALRLLALEYDAEAYLSAFRADEKPPILKDKIYLAICRHDHQVRRHPLEPLEYQLLVALDGTRTLPQAIECAATNEEAEIVISQALQTWLMKWIQNGFFAMMDAGV